MALALVVPSTVAAQANGGSSGIAGLYISGSVRDDETHVGVKSVVVELKSESGNIASPTVMSGTSGEFQFNGVGSGDYHVMINAKGYEPASLQITLGGTPLMNVIVPLRRLNDISRFENLSISAHELTVPDKARDSFSKGVKLLTTTKPNYERAIVQFQRAIDEFSTYYEAYAEMGIAYQHLGQTPAAEQALRKSIELSSNQYADALFLLAEMLDDLNRYAEAEVVARQGIRADETSWRGHLALARALAALKHAREAEASAAQASLLNPNSAEIFLVLGNIHIQERNYQSVIKDFDTYLRLEPRGSRSDAVRQSREQARKAMLKTQGGTGESAPKQ